MKVKFLAILAVSLSVGEIFGCGISWKLPTNQYDSVNEKGFLSYWDQIGSLDFGENLKLPLILNFRSVRDSKSAYGGYGWMIPLLESNVVQLEENRFMLVQPDGINRYFGRKNTSETTLIGDGGWAAELKGNIFTAWASCGWKLIYVSGKISSMVSPENRRFDWVRSGDRVNEIREGGNVKLTVKWNNLETEMVGIESDGQTFAFERSEKPRVQTLAKQNVVAAMDSSLTTVQLPDKSFRTYVFGVDDHLSPTLKVGSRLLTWNPETKHISSDGEWKYQVTPAQNDGYAAISRKNSKGESEFWHNDRSKGVEIVRKSNGYERLSTIFLSGKLFGRPRWESTTQLIENQLRTQKVAYTYDESGMCIGSIVTWTSIHDGEVQTDRVQTFRNSELVEDYNNIQNVKFLKDSTTGEVTLIWPAAKRSMKIVRNGEAKAVTWEKN